MDTNVYAQTIPCGECESSTCSKQDIAILSQIRNNVFLLRRGVATIFEALLGLAACNNIGPVVENQLRLLDFSLINVTCYIDNFDENCYRCSPCSDFFNLTRARALLVNIKIYLCSLQNRDNSKPVDVCSLIFQGERLEIDLALILQFIDQTIQDHTCFTVI